MYNEIVRFITFGCIGVLNTSIDVGLWQVLSRILSKPHKSISFVGIQLSPSIIAHTISFFTGALFSFCANSILTFGDKTGSTVDINQLFPFMLVTLSTWALTSILLYVLIKAKIGYIHSFFRMVSKVIFKKNISWALSAKLITVVCGIAINYVGYMFLVF